MIYASQIVIRMLQKRCDVYTGVRCSWPIGELGICHRWASKRMRPPSHSQITGFTLPHLFPTLSWPVATRSFGRAILLGDSIIPDCRPNHRERRSLAGLITPTLAGSRRLKTKAISLPLTGVLHGLGLVPT